VEALALVLQFEPSLSVAGRTDAGVHARGQVVSFQAPPAIDPLRVQRAVNGVLAPEVVLTRVRWAPDGFDARRSAMARVYRYRMDVGPVPDPFVARFTWHHPAPVSVAPMRAAAGFLVGEHDFYSFCRAPDPTSSTVRTLERLTVSRRDDHIDVVARAGSFLHQMVRSLVGTLVAAGEGRISPPAIPEVFAARDRAAAGPIAPPHGLALERVMYRVPALHSRVAALGDE